MANKTILGGNSATFSGMMADGFGIVTVMNVKVFDALTAEEYANHTATDIASAAASGALGSKTLTPLCTIDTLKIANVTQEGPAKTVTGGQYSNPLIKFGKSARLEMQDALGRIEAIQALGGGIAEWDDAGSKTYKALHFGEDFTGPKLLVGDSFFIDKKTGQQVGVNIIFYQFLPDSIFNLTQDAEGDATVFDMNGDLLTTVIKTYDSGTAETPHGFFYSIVEKNSASEAVVGAITNDTTGVGINPPVGDAWYSVNDGLTWSETAPATYTQGDRILARVVKDGKIIGSTTIIAAVTKQ